MLLGLSRCGSMRDKSCLLGPSGRFANQGGVRRLFFSHLLDHLVAGSGETAILPQELKAIADRQTQGRVTLIAIDAHWCGDHR
eukprot:1161094-Pelagomonas_calceolata.AAC.7